MPAHRDRAGGRLQAAGPSATPPAAADGPNRLRKEGDYWTLRFAGRTARLKEIVCGSRSPEA